MPRNRTPGRHSKIPAVPTETRRPVAYVVAIGVAALASLATMAGLTITPTDNGGSPRAEPAASTPTSSWSMDTGAPQREPTGATSRDGRGDAPTSARPDAPRSSQESADSGQESTAKSRATGGDSGGDSGNDSGNDSGGDSDADEPRLKKSSTPRKSTEVEATRPPDPDPTKSTTKSQTDPPEETSRSASPSESSPEPSTSRCASRSPSGTPTWSLTCRIGGLLP